MSFGSGAATGGRLLAGHALDRAGPEIEIGAAEAGLQFQRALRVGQPVFRDLADGLDHVGDVVGQFVFDLAFLARLHVGGERLAAFLDHAREIAREGLDIDLADCGRVYCVGLIASRPRRSLSRCRLGRRSIASRVSAHGFAGAQQARCRAPTLLPPY